MYFFYLDSVLMPITPGKLTMKIKNKNKTLDLISGGEINIPKSPGLTEISFELLLPSSEYSFAMYENGFKSPNYYLELLENLKRNRQAFPFTVIRSISAEMLLRYSAGLVNLPSSVLRDYDLNNDGVITAADARILLRSQSGLTVLNDTNMKCTVEDYTVTEDAEKYGRDINVSVNLKQYTDYALKTAVYSIVK